MIERIAFISIILAALGADAWWFYVKWSHYQKKYAEFLEQKRAFEKEMAQKQQQLAVLEEEVKKLKIQLEKKKREEELKSKEYERRMKELSKYLAYLPPETVWPDLIKKIQVWALKLGLNVSKVVTESGFQKDEFATLAKLYQVWKFKITVKGDYIKVIEFLWFLENMINLKDPITGKVWKAIIKMDSNSLTIDKLDPDSDTITITLQLLSFFRRINR